IRDFHVTGVQTCALPILTCYLMKENLRMQITEAEIKSLQNEYSHYLFRDYLPFVHQHVVDHESGGFMCHTNSEGNNLSTHKRTWYDGRGIWVYSYLYNHFGQKPEYLDIATKTVELVLKVKSDEKDYWPWSYSRTGEDLEEQRPDIYGNLFVAEG